ncbi:MAG: hypothetical protein HW386_1981 [Gammaproteobacteria bacterium]|nr:hypothetical protein [Gammaproteobacteria bacterium]
MADSSDNPPEAAVEEKPKRSFFGRLFGGRSEAETEAAEETAATSEVAAAPATSEESDAETTASAPEAAATVDTGTIASSEEQTNSAEVSSPPDSTEQSPAPQTETPIADTAEGQPKQGFFKRLFGGKQQEQTEPAEEVVVATETEAEAPVVAAEEPETGAEIGTADLSTSNDTLTPLPDPGATASVNAEDENTIAEAEPPAETVTDAEETKASGGFFSKLFRRSKTEPTDTGSTDANTVAMAEEPASALDQNNESTSSSLPLTAPGPESTAPPVRVSPYRLQQ